MAPVPCDRAPAGAAKGLIFSFYPVLGDAAHADRIPFLVRRRARRRRSRGNAAAEGRPARAGCPGTRFCRGFNRPAFSGGAGPHMVLSGSRDRRGVAQPQRRKRRSESICTIPDVGPQFFVPGAVQNPYCMSRAVNEKCLTKGLSSGNVIDLLSSRPVGQL